MAGNEVTSGLRVSLFWILLSWLKFLSLLHSFLAFSPGTLGVPGITWKLSIGICQTWGEGSSLVSSPVCSYVMCPLCFNYCWPWFLSSLWISGQCIHILVPNREDIFGFLVLPATYMPFLGDWGLPTAFLTPHWYDQDLEGCPHCSPPDSPLSLSCSMA